MGLNPSISPKIHPWTGYPVSALVFNVFSPSSSSFLPPLLPFPLLPVTQFLVLLPFQFPELFHTCSTAKVINTMPRQIRLREYVNKSLPSQKIFAGCVEISLPRLRSCAWFYKLRNFSCSICIKSITENFFNNVWTISSSAGKSSLTAFLLGFLLLLTMTGFSNHIAIVIGWRMEYANDQPRL